MNKFNITLDPGHVYGYNKGIVVSYAEGTKMYYFAQYLKLELEKTGLFNVGITRKDIMEDLSLPRRGQIAIENKSDIFISLHSDAFSTSNAIGVSVFRSIKRPESQELGEILGKGIAEFMKLDTGVTQFRGCVTKRYTDNKGVEQDYYGVIRNSVMSDEYVEYSFIIEHGFHTNLKECMYLNDVPNLKELAKYEAGLLYDYFKDKVLVAPYEVFTNIKGYSTAIDAMGNNNPACEVEKGKYYIFREYTNGAINITQDETGKIPGAWVNPLTNIKPVVIVESFNVITPILGYKTASDAINGTNSVSTIPVGNYLVFRKFSNGAINITSDPEGDAPGWWINPNTNKIPEKTKEQLVAELDTSKLTPLTMSEQNFAVVTPQQVVKFIKSNNPNFKLTCSVEELVYSFMQAGFLENIRWDIAICQSIHETGFFKYGGQVQWDQNNFSGLGATNDGARGATFESAFDGAMAQIQHLKAYANSTSICHNELLDPRFTYVTRGWAPYLEWLGAGENPKNKIYGVNIGWAVPGNSYGQSIAKMIELIKLIEIK